jgi:hypothetical protein
MDLTGDSTKLWNVYNRPAVNDDEAKRLAEALGNDERILVFKELVKTEQTYLEDLSSIMNVYVKPFSQKKVALLENHLVVVFFTTLEQIDTLHGRLYKDICSVYAKLIKLPPLGAHPQVESLLSELGSVFIQYSGLFKLYRQYMRLYDIALAEVTNCKDEVVQELLQAGQTSTLMKGATLDSLVIKPIQRLPRYELLLKRILEFTDQEESSCYVSVQEAVQSLSKSVNYVNEVAGERARASKLLALESQFLGSISLLNASRRFIYEGKLKMIKSKKDYKYYFHLFNDMLLYSTKAMVGFEAQGSISFVGLAVSQNQGLGGVPLIFLHSEKESCTLVSDDPQETLKWIGFLKDAVASTNRAYARSKESMKILMQKTMSLQGRTKSLSLLSNTQSLSKTFRDRSDSKTALSVGTTSSSPPAATTPPQFSLQISTADPTRECGNCGTQFDDRFPQKCANCSRKVCTHCRMKRKMVPKLSRFRMHKVCDTCFWLIDSMADYSGLSLEINDDDQKDDLQIPTPVHELTDYEVIYNVMCEVSDSESAYVCNLQLLLQVYIRPLQQLIMYSHHSTTQEEEKSRPSKLSKTIGSMRRKTTTVIPNAVEVTGHENVTMTGKAFDVSKLPPMLSVHANNIEEIFTLNSEFLEDLEQLMDNWGDDKNIIVFESPRSDKHDTPVEDAYAEEEKLHKRCIKVLKQFGPLLKIYNQFALTHRDSSSIFSSPEFEKFFLQCEASSKEYLRAMSFDLSGQVKERLHKLLSSPLSRIDEYEGLLIRARDGCRMGQLQNLKSEFSDILNVVQESKKHFHKAISEQERVSKLQDLENKFINTKIVLSSLHVDDEDSKATAETESLPFHRAISPTVDGQTKRYMVKTGMLVKVSKAKHRKAYQFDLLSDILIYSEVQGKGLVFKLQMPVPTLKVEEIAPNSEIAKTWHIKPSEAALFLRSSLKSFPVIAKNQQERQEWLSAFDSLGCFQSSNAE